MQYGTLYGIGIGPGDPDLITVKGSMILARCREVFVPKARIASESTALAIGKKYLHPEATVRELVFPMMTDRERLRAAWLSSAGEVANVLATGADACFLTLGDAMFYSTNIYLVRALREICPQVKIVTIPGVTAMSAAAALTEFPVGTAKLPVTIIPATDDSEELREMLARKGTKVLMKIGKRCDRVLDLLEEMGLLKHSVFVSRAGMDDERIETDLRVLRDGCTDTTGYLSIILVGTTDAEEQP